jgi:hypothetical protein
MSGRRDALNVTHRITETICAVVDYRDVDMIGAELVRRAALIGLDDHPK